MANIVRMSEEKALVSIVIPAYNAENTIVETLDSVINQTYNKIETIVVDDGSTDSTLEIIRRFILDKPSIQVYTKENEGLPATRNYGFQFVKGKYLLFLDADDLIAPEFVKLSVDKFESDTSVDIVTTQVEHFERESLLYTPPTFSSDTILKVNCFMITSLIKSEAFRDIGMFDATMTFHEDWDMWIRMTQKYNNVVHIDQPLFKYRKRFSRDSMCDLNYTETLANKMHLYIYQKHFERYLEFGHSLKELFETKDKYIHIRKKYYNVWYRKIYYAFFPKKKPSNN